MPFIEELSQEWGNDFRLEPIIVNFPWACTIEQGYAPRSRTEGQMHWKTISSDDTAVIPDVAQVFE